jgi:hypothetical protein
MLRHWIACLVVATIILVEYQGCANIDLLDEMKTAQRDSLWSGEIGKERKDHFLERLENVRSNVLSKIDIRTSCSSGDTLLWFEAEDVVTHDIYGSIWTPLASFTYLSRADSPPDSVGVKRDHTLYSDLVTTQIIAGNFETIRHMQSSATGVLTPQNIVHVFRVTGQSTKIQMEYFTFLEFAGCFHNR